jgi:hypothetical protein
MVDEPKEKAKTDAQYKTGDDRKVEGRMLAAMDDIAGETAETEREFATEIQECADEDECTSKQEKCSAKIAKVHRGSLDGWMGSRKGHLEKVAP